MTETEKEAIRLNVVNGEKVEKDFQVVYWENELKINQVNKKRLICYFELLAEFNRDNDMRKAQEDMKEIKDTIEWIERKLSSLRNI